MYENAYVCTQCHTDVILVWYVVIWTHISSYVMVAYVSMRCGVIQTAWWSDMWPYRSEATSMPRPFQCIRAVDSGLEKSNVRTNAYICRSKRRNPRWYVCNETKFDAYIWGDISYIRGHLHTLESYRRSRNSIIHMLLLAVCMLIYERMRKTGDFNRSCVSLCMHM
jgi:hypothetical protein